MGSSNTRTDNNYEITFIPIAVLLSSCGAAVRCERHKQKPDRCEPVGQHELGPI